MQAFCRRAVKKGFDFTLMVVGESGLGKSTLINSMFLCDIYNKDLPNNNNNHKDKIFKPDQTLSIEAKSVLITEKNVNVKLTLVDTPGK